MELINSSRMPAAFTLGVMPSGREMLVVVVKGTFAYPQGEGRAGLAQEQQPVVVADTFSGEPGLSAPIQEMDLAPFKRRCDVLVVANAHAPTGKPTSRVVAGIRVGRWQKAVAVLGDRRWQATAAGARPSAPGHFVTMPISYDRAFGGVDRDENDVARHVWYRRNPAGRGFHADASASGVDGSPVSNIESIDVPVTAPNGDYEPISLGCVGRAWAQRAPFAGTYDAAWLEQRFPFLPDDFDDRYYQAAPVDQQIDIPTQEQAVVLVNLDPSGRRRFLMPVFQAPVHVFPRRGGKELYSASLDTITFEPDRERYTLTWRLARPLNRDLFEIAQVVVGRKDATWWRERERTSFPVPVVAAPFDRAGRS